MSSLKAVDNARPQSGHILLSLTCVIAIIWLFSKVGVPDDVNTHYKEMLDVNNYAKGRFRNYRYFSALLGTLIDSTNIRYFSLVPVWISLFAAGLFWASYEFVRFIRVRVAWFPVLLVAVASNGYMADIFRFVLEYPSYAYGLMGSALSMRVIRTLPTISGIGIAIIGGLIAFTTYQPLGLILPFAAALLMANATIHQHNAGDATLSSIKIVIVFIVSALLFIVLKEVLGPDSGRSVEFSNIIPNLPKYIRHLYHMYVNGLGLYTPLHERMIYGSAILILAIYVSWNFIHRRNIHAALAMLGILAAIMMLPGPFGLLIPIGVGTPRQLVGAALFQAGSVAIVVSFFWNKFQKVVSFGILVALATSVAVQMDTAAYFRGQGDRDALAVELIVSDIDKISDVDQNTLIAVSSTWRNGVQKRRAISAFSRPWSNSAIFRVKTGNFIRHREVPEGACEEPLESMWRIEQVDEVFVICMD